MNAISSLISLPGAFHCCVSLQVSPQTSVPLWSIGGKTACSHSVTSGSSDVSACCAYCLSAILLGKMFGSGGGVSFLFVACVYLEQQLHITAELSPVITKVCHHCFWSETCTSSLSWRGSSSRDLKSCWVFCFALSVAFYICKPSVTLTTFSNSAGIPVFTFLLNKMSAGASHASLVRVCNLMVLNTDQNLTQPSFKGFFFNLTMISNRMLDWG